MCFSFRERERERERERFPSAVYKKKAAFHHERKIQLLTNLKRWSPACVYVYIRQLGKVYLFTAFFFFYPSHHPGRYTDPTTTSDCVCTYMCVSALVCICKRSRDISRAEKFPGSLFFAPPFGSYTYTHTHTQDTCTHAYILCTYIKQKRKKKILTARTPPSLPLSRRSFSLMQKGTESIKPMRIICTAHTHERMCIYVHVAGGWVCVYVL